MSLLVSVALELFLLPAPSCARPTARTPTEDPGACVPHDVNYRLGQRNWRPFVPSGTAPVGKPGVGGIYRALTINLSLWPPWRHASVRLRWNAEVWGLYSLCAGWPLPSGRCTGGAGRIGGSPTGFESGHGTPKLTSFSTYSFKQKHPVRQKSPWATRNSARMRSRPGTAAQGRLAVERPLAGTRRPSMLAVAPAIPTSDRSTRSIFRELEEQARDLAFGATPATRGFVQNAGPDPTSPCTLCPCLRSARASSLRKT